MRVGDAGAELLKLQRLALVLMSLNMLRRRNAFSCYQIGQKVLRIDSMVFSVWVGMVSINGRVAVADRLWMQP